MSYSYSKIGQIDDTVVEPILESLSIAPVSAPLVSSFSPVTAPVIERPTIDFLKGRIKTIYSSQMESTWLEGFLGKILSCFKSIREKINNLSEIRAADNAAIDVMNRVNNTPILYTADEQRHLETAKALANSTGDTRNEWKYQLAKAESLLRSGYDTLALEILNSVTIDHPSAELYYMIGTAQKSLNKNSEACSSYYSALKLSKNDKEMERHCINGLNNALEGIFKQDPVAFALEASKYDKIDRELVHPTHVYLTLEKNLIAFS